MQRSIKCIKSTSILKVNTENYTIQQENTNTKKRKALKINHNTYLTCDTFNLFLKTTDHKSSNSSHLLSSAVLLILTYHPPSKKTTPTTTLQLITLATLKIYAVQWPLSLHTSHMYSQLVQEETLNPARPVWTMWIQVP